MTKFQIRGRPTSLLALFLFLTACSGGSDGQPPPPPPTCTGNGPFLKAAFPILGEVEPNDDIATAYPATFAAPAPDESVGFLLFGSVHDSLDPVDTIAFSSPRSTKFFFKLCPEICNTASGDAMGGIPDSLSTDIAYFDVLDASGGIIGTTRTNLPTQNYVELCVDSGVITYIMISTRNTSNAVQSYVVSTFDGRL